MDDKEEKFEPEEEKTLGEASPKIEQSESDPEPQTQTQPENETDPEPSEDVNPDKNPYINTTSPYTTAGMSSGRKRGPKKLLLALLAIILIVVLGFLLKGKLFKSSTATPTPSPVSQESPTPQESATPSPSLDRSKLSVQIENGSGTSGVAGTASSFLKNLGYNVVSTGNADNFNFTGVTIQVKSSKSDFLTILKNDLKANYTISSATSDLSATSSADALVIIGK